MQIKLCYFNQHWNVYIYTEGGFISWMKEPEWENRIVEGKRGEYILRHYSHPEIPIYSFGFWCFNPLARPGHGGEWSSNSMAINSVFGTELWEVAVDQISVAVPISWLKEIMGDQVKWKSDGIYGQKIISVKGVKNDYMAWTEIEPLTNSIL